jgi:hypothetical protein
MRMRRLAAALAASCALCTTAGAQPPGNQDPRLPAATRHQPEAGRTADAAVRAERSRRPEGMFELNDGGDVAIGIGRFSILEPARPRSNMEAERDPTNVRRRERGIGGLGLRISF